MRFIKRDNPALKGVLLREYTHPALHKQRPGQLIALMSNVKVGDEESRSKCPRPGLRGLEAGKKGNDS